MNSPRCCKTASELKKFHNDKDVVLVPTMGALHEGHLSLIKYANEYAKKNNALVCVSIFVNPLQFGPNEDFDVYPRQLEYDLEKLNQLADSVFIPDRNEMYPSEQEILIHAPKLGSQLEGKARPNFFTGILTVVCKLFQLVQPHTAIFGRKDYQQLILIRKMVEQLHLPVNILDCPIVREKNGLALSSRNEMLTAKHRNLAPLLNEQLTTVAKEISAGADAKSSCEKAFNTLTKAGFEVRYVECLSPVLDAFDPTTNKDFIVLGSVLLGSVNLIDNVEANAKK